MDTKIVKYCDESLNIRSFYLRLLKKKYIILFAAFIGAVIAGGIYYLVTVIFGPERQYEAQAQFYITYSDDAYILNEQGEKVLDWYNGSTWTLFVFRDNDLLPEIVKRVNEKGSSITEDELKASVIGEIPSNERFLQVTVRNTDKELTDKITDAFIEELEKYPSYCVLKAFDSIACTSRSEVYLEKVENRMGVAIVFGAILAAVLAFFALLLANAVDEAVYVPEECEKRYGFPVLGTVFDADKTNELLRDELAKLYDKYVSDKENVVIISSDSVDNASFSEKDLESLKKTLGSDYDSKLSKLTAIAASDIGTADGAILAVPYGKKNAAMTEHIVSQLKKNNCPVIGIVFTRADIKFIKRYYGIR